jgi:hypothetical protein
VTVAPPLTLTTALKEWAVAVEALTQGETILLLRKGGIQEPTFSINRPQFWLYPTYEHQKPHLLKPTYAEQVTPVASGWHPERVEIQAWAEITHSFQVEEAPLIQALLPFHIWTEAFVIERLKWKPRLAVSVLLLRVYRLSQPQSLVYRPEYGGCKSWIELQSLVPDTSMPVLAAEPYQQQVEAIATAIHPSAED